MHPLEVILLLALTIATASRVHRGTDGALPPAAWSIAVLVMMMHLTHEGWRWGMLPAYLLIAYLGVALVSSTPSVRVAWIASVICLVGAAVAFTA